MKFYVEPKELWDFYYNNREQLKRESVVVAENADTNHTVCVTDEDGEPILMVFRGDLMVYKEEVISAADAVFTMNAITEEYLIPVEEDDDPPEIEDDEVLPEGSPPEGLTREDMEDMVYEREDELLQATKDYLEVVLDLADAETELKDDFGDLMEGLLSFLSESGYAIYRPEIIELDGKEYFIRCIEDVADGVEEPEPVPEAAP